MHEWDWPPPRHRRYYRTIDYQPSGWSSPSAKRAIRIYWRVTITLIKALISVALSIIAIGSIWFLWIIVTRFNY
jgi:hypothetical protein